MLFLKSETSFIRGLWLLLPTNIFYRDELIFSSLQKYNDILTASSTLRWYPLIYIYTLFIYYLLHNK